MHKEVKLFGIAGSLREGSFNRAALEAARDLLPQKATLEIFERLGDIPLFNQDHENNPPDSVVDLKDKITSADAIVFATPEYNYSIPGVLKNAIDWASRPYGDSAWEGKPVGIMSASGGMLGGSRAQYHLRQTFVFLNMHPLNHPEVIISHANEKIDEKTGTISDSHTKKKIAELMEALVKWTIELQVGEKVAEELAESDEYQRAYGRMSDAS